MIDLLSNTIQRRFLMMDQNNIIMWIPHEYIYMKGGECDERNVQVCVKQRIF